MEEIVLVKKYTDKDIGPINVKEVLRYMGQPEEEGLDIEEMVKEVAKAKLGYRVAFFRTEGTIFADESRNLAKVMAGCHSTYLMAATLGVEMDRLIAKYSKVSPTKALILDAIGTERVEALCDRFCLDMNSNEISRGNSLTKRYSPGYGDFKLENQAEIFKLLDCPKRIGLTLTDSLLMSPTKSVTAVMGVLKSGDKKPALKQCLHKCTQCDNLECEFRGR
ncbi:MAG: Vitamin B12 dependent methionine synthase activation subunit [Clostridia bacterium]|nr:Vitamin B12 dependent methionine synthase activation subunit [Clostridia bacterium]